MAIFKVINQKENDYLSLHRKVNYIENFCATSENLIYGTNVSCFNTYKEMMLVKKVFNQSNGKAYNHFILSVEETDEVTEVDFMDVAIDVCNMIATFRGNYQVLMAVHTDTDILHVHYIANNIDYIEGSRVNVNRSYIYEIKCKINESLELAHLKPIRMKYC